MCEEENIIIRNILIFIILYLIFDLLAEIFLIGLFILN
jgi:hypothetical protein